jgi:hypothetical protein
MDDKQKIKAVWEDTLNRSPLYSTLKKATTFNVKVNIV